MILTTLILLLTHSFGGGLSDDNTLRDLNVININTANVSEECRIQVSAMLKALRFKEKWSYMMLDASARVPSGLLTWNPYDLGNYDECVGIKAELENGRPIFGKYCLSTIPLPEDYIKNFTDMELNLQADVQFKPQFLGTDQSTVGVHLAFCVPDGCTAEDLNNGLISIFSEEFCSKKTDNSNLPIGSVITIVILGLIVAIALLSTGYDLYLQRTETKPISEIFTAFSIYTNGRKLFKFTKSKEQLTCLNGLRAISMMWVILGHEYTLTGPFNNYMDMKKWTNNSANMFVIGASVSVDTFFAIGGLVTVYSFLKSCEKGARFNIFFYYLHRYLRLTPALAVVMLFYATLLKYVGDGPMWAIVDRELVYGCKKMWWHALLYIQNYTVKDAMCVAQGWYLSVDMQLFLLSPLILLPLKRWPNYTLVGLLVLCLAGIISPFLLAWKYSVSASMLKLNVEGMQKYYMATHARFGPYVIGMIAGYLIYNIKLTNYRLRVHKVFVVIFWIFLLTGLTACVYAGFDLNINKDRLPNSIFIALSRPLWALGICLLVIACILGYGGPINEFLSIPVFQFISKLSYSMYLTHYAILEVKLASSRTVMHFSNSEILFLYWGYFFETILFSLALCLLFESPMKTIEKILFGGAMTKPKPTI